MKNKTITTLVIIVICLCLSGCKYSNGGSSISQQVIQSLGNPAVKQMQSNLSNTYWNASMSSVKSSDIVYSMLFGEATGFMKIASISGMKDEPNKWYEIAHTLSLCDFFISNNSLSFYYTDNEGDRHIFLTSDKFKFTESGAQAVFYIQNDREYSHVLNFFYINDTQASIDWSLGETHEGDGPYDYIRNI